MNDNELDDLFRSNADYLADQPPRDFDKEVFWQQLQTAIPPKNDSRKKPFVWGWAAAVLLMGMMGGIWWIRQETEEIDKVTQATPATKKTIPGSVPYGHIPPQITTQDIAQGTPSTTRSVPDGRIPAPILDPEQGKPAFRGREQSPQEVPLRPKPSENDPVIVATQEYSPPESIVEATNPLPELVIPAVPEKPHYRVVHINEIKERKQQDAKARTRMAFRIGLPSASRLTTQSDYEAPLSIPIQN
jgi:hypothetical protein